MRFSKKAYEFCILDIHLHIQYSVFPTDMTLLLCTLFYKSLAKCGNNKYLSECNIYIYIYIYIYI